MGLATAEVRELHDNEMWDFPFASEVSGGKRGLGSKDEVKVKVKVVEAQVTYSTPSNLHHATP